MIPSSESRPWVGLIALVPQHADGIRSEPHVSLPSAAGIMPAASAAALPPLEPPATRSSAHGLPTWSVVPPAANSWVWVWPSSTMPWRRSRAQHLGVLAGHVALQHAAGGGEGQALHSVEVLEAQRDPAQQRARRRAASRSSAARADSRASSGYSRTQALIAVRGALECRGAAVARLDPAPGRPRSAPPRTARVRAAASAASSTPRSAGRSGSMRSVVVMPSRLRRWGTPRR